MPRLTPSVFPYGSGVGTLRQGDERMNEDFDDTAGWGYPLNQYYDRRRYERRVRCERRGPLRWDPKAKEKQRRNGEGRRRDESYIRQ